MAISLSDYLCLAIALRPSKFRSVLVFFFTLIYKLRGLAKLLKSSFFQLCTLIVTYAIFTIITHPFNRLLEGLVVKFPAPFRLPPHFLAARFLQEVLTCIVWPFLVAITGHLHENGNVGLLFGFWASKLAIGTIVGPVVVNALWTGLRGNLMVSLFLLCSGTLVLYLTPTEQPLPDSMIGTDLAVEQQQVVIPSELGNLVYFAPNVRRLQIIIRPMVWELLILYAVQKASASVFQHSLFYYIGMFEDSNVDWRRVDMAVLYDGVGAMLGEIFFLGLFRLAGKTHLFLCRYMFGMTFLWLPVVIGFNIFAAYNTISFKFWVLFSSMVLNGTLGLMKEVILSGVDAEWIRKWLVYIELGGSIGAYIGTLEMAIFSWVIDVHNYRPSEAYFLTVLIHTSACCALIGLSTVWFKLDEP